MWKKQAEALGFAVKRVDRGKGVCLYMEMGTGKTRVAIHLLEHLFRKHHARLIYVAAPLSALHVWVENWHEWGTAPVAFIDLHESGSAGLRLAKRLAADGFPVICLVNYEAAWQIGYKRIPRRRRGETVRVLEKVDTAMQDLKWDVGILDESTAIKTPGSKVSKFFRRKLAPRSTYRIVMTGSAYTKRPLDVWAQINFACGDEVFPPVFLPFKSVYAIPHPYIRGAVLGYHNLGDLVRKMSKVAVMLKKSDVLDLPPAVHETRLIELSAKSRKIYDDLVEQTIAELDAQTTVSADHVFTSIRKLMQITGGFVYPDPDEDTPDIKPDPVRLSTEKLDVLMEILEERDSPTVIVTQFDEEERIIAAAIRKRFGFTPKVLNGSVKGAEARHKMIQAAAEDLAFIVKERVGAKGVDMRFADMIVFFSHSYDTERYEQMLARNHRGGQTKNITYIHLLCKNTIDMKIMRALERDLSLAASIEHDWRALFA
jgi:non-specific serine/threonine protein kinase